MMRLARRRRSGVSSSSSSSGGSRGCGDDGQHGRMTRARCSARCGSRVRLRAMSILSRSSSRTGGGRGRIDLDRRIFVGSTHHSSERGGEGGERDGLRSAQRMQRE